MKLIHPNIVKNNAIKATEDGKFHKNNDLSYRIYFYIRDYVELNLIWIKFKVDETH